MSTVNVPILRFGREYESLDVNEVAGYADGAVLARVGQANAGLIRRDLKRVGEHARALRELPIVRLIEICREAGELFLNGTLPLNDAGDEQSPGDYVAALSATSGLPHTLCRANARKIHTVLTGMPGILFGLMRGMAPQVLDSGMGSSGGLPVCYANAADALGVVLPSNSPGVNSIWMPSLALKTPVVLKPGREEPWTPLRILRAFLAAGLPPEAVAYYPTDHEGAATILEVCGRSQLFGDENTTRPYANDPRVEIHGPGRSKVLLGADEADDWEEHLDVLVASVADNGGRSCINASSIFVPAHADEIADALARRLSEIVPRAPDDEGAKLAAFANPKMAAFIEASIENGVAGGGAEEVTSRYRDGERAVEAFGGNYLLPTVVRCASVEHPLANTEFLFPFTSVVEVPQDEMLARIGPTLVASAITRDEAFREALVASPLIDRLNLGAVATSHVEWDQPHEGNLFEALYKRRAIQRALDW